MFFLPRNMCQDVFLTINATASPPPPNHPDPMIDISSHCCLLPASIAIRPAISVPTYHQLGSCVPTYHQLWSMWTISPHYLCKYLGLLWASAFIFHHYRSVNTTTTTTNCGNLWDILSLRDFSKTWVFPSKPVSWPIQTTQYTYYYCILSHYSRHYKKCHLRLQVSGKLNVIEI